MLSVNNVIMSIIKNCVRFCPSLFTLWGSCGKVMFFTPVCQSFCSHPLDRHPRADTPPPGRHPLGRHPLGRHPRADTSQPDTPRQTPPRVRPPGSHPPIHLRRHWSGRLASYWDAFLFLLSMQQYKKDVCEEVY